MITKLGGRYELQEQIGDGGMAIVYRAIDTLLGRQVAVKMLRSQFARDDEFVTRFRQEAQSAASLSHPNIVNLYDVGMTHENEYYIVMEYVDGPTLKEVIRDRGPLSPKEVVDITTQICDALEHAHDHHIIHRDIKPHNILLTKNGRVKVTDFGIARAITGNTITNHQTTSVLGSVHYFSPEQARGGVTDIKSDIYSLGVVMYEMATKQLPFSGDSPVSVALKHLQDKFIEPRELNRSIPQSVENVILQCLVKSPSLRYKNMHAVKLDLSDALIHPNVAKFKMPVDVTEETIAIPAVGTTTDYEQVARRSRESKPKEKRRRWWTPVVWGGVAVSVIGIGVVTAYYLFMNLFQVPNVNVPNVVGQTATAAVKALEADKFSESQIVEQTATDSHPKGVVFGQDPAGGTQVKPSHTIHLFVSNGPEQAQIPDLLSMSADQAQAELQGYGFDNVVVDTVQSSQPGGTVVAVDPTPGTTVNLSAKITLQVSAGSTVTIPNVIGKTLDEAKQELQNANLVVGQITDMAYPAPDGTVFNILPGSVGDKVAAGTQINLFVANNSGESGGGLGNGTSSGNSTGLSNNTTASTAGGSSSSMTQTQNVSVGDYTGKSIQVQIYVTDMNGSQVLQVNQTITKTTSWSIPVTVSPQIPGEIVVYQNGLKTKDITVSYGS